MKLEKITGFAALTLGLLMFAGSANATTLYQWDLYDTTVGDEGNINKGTDETYSKYGYDLNFDGFEYDTDFNTISADLIENNRGSNEEGLGVNGSGIAGTSTSNNGEVNLGQWITIDLGTGWTNFNSWAINFNSVDHSEVAFLYSVINDAWTTLLLEASPTDSNTWLSFVPDSQFLVFFVGSDTQGCGPDSPCPDDVLLKSIRAYTPEPGTLIMMLLGLGLMGFSRRRKSA